MRNTLVSVVSTVSGAVLTACFLLLWLTIWPVWNFFPTVGFDSRSSTARFRALAAPLADARGSDQRWRDRVASLLTQGVHRVESSGAPRGQPACKQRYRGE